MRVYLKTTYYQNTYKHPVYDNTHNNREKLKQSLQSKSLRQSTLVRRQTLKRDINAAGNKITIPF